MGARGALQILHLASRRVVHVFDQVDRPRWSADGRRVIFISGQDGTPDLWQIEIDPATGNPAGEPERLTSGLAVSSFAIAPGDQQILAVTQKSHGNSGRFQARPNVSQTSPRGSDGRRASFWIREADGCPMGEASRFNPTAAAASTSGHSRRRPANSPG